MAQELLAVPLATSLFAFGVCALVAHALVLLTSRASAFKKYTAQQMLIALLAVITSSLSAGGRVVVRTISGVVQWWLFFAVVFTGFSLVYVTYTEYPDLWLATTRFYNDNVGPWVHQTVVVPLKITDILLRGLLPLWNSWVWFTKALATQGLLPVMIKEVGVVKQMATTLIGFVEHLSHTLQAFVEAFFCEGQACLHPEKGVLDLLSPMGDVREFAALGVQLLRGFCATLAAPIDLLVFPLMDLNLAEGVHNLGNAIVQMAIVIPRATVVRCALANEDQFKVLMCTPDLNPFFNFLVAGVSSIGLAIDNWLNVAFLIVETATSGGDPSRGCDTESGGMMPDLVSSNGVFAAASFKAVVGLTDWLYAITDGVTAVYMGHTDGGQMKTQTWLHAGMDVRMGVAAVTYSSVHDLDVSALSSGRTAGSMQTTAMMGCNCTDDALLGMRIVCSILPMAGIPASASPDDYLIQVLFPDTAAAKLYVCDGVDVYVKSVRWSFTRYSSKDATLGSGGEHVTLPTTDCITRGTCRELDATVWVVPLCGQERNANGEKACIDSAPCFPFCMAARSAGAGRDNLMLTKAGRWREGLTILEQDCAISTSSPGLVGSTMGGAGTVSWAGVADTGVSQRGDQAQGIFASTYASDRACARSPRVTSVVDQEKQRLNANVQVSGQPFAITGDTTLMEADMGNDGVSSSRLERMVGSVQVERLEGNEANTFSLNPIPHTLPSWPRVLVPLKESERLDTTHVTVPYSYQTTRIAAVNSRNYVFYASNPNLDVFGAYFDYCSTREDQDKLQRMGLLVMTSFAPTRIYRVAAYRRCATYSCGADLVRFTTIDGFDMKFDKDCALTFNTSVVALEYLNEDNVAVTVQSSHVTEYDATSQGFAGPRTRTTTYWLNPTTMGLSTTVWQTSVPASNFAVLCPSLQRLPRMGSFAAELINSATFLLKYAASAILYTPGVVQVWRAGGACPQAGGAASYHSVLGRCGAELYSLDDFFDSVDDATAIFWHSLSLAGKLIAPASHQAIAAPLTQVLDGMSQYGEASIDLWAARASVLTLTRVPIKDQLTQLWATMQPTDKAQGGSHVSSALSGWSRFSYKALSTIGVDVVKRLLNPAQLEPLTAQRVFKLIWANLYDLKDEFEAAITQKTRMGCAGLKLIFGLDNPWSDLVYHECVAAAELTSAQMRLAINMFVLIPMSKCVCKSSMGQQVDQFVMSECAPSLPTALVPTLLTITTELSGAQMGYDNLRCERVLEYVRGEISASLDKWFENQHLALTALGSAVDYATATFDSKAGECMDFANDPHVVVIVPQPVDYFQRCAATSSCRQKCKAEWVQMQEATAPSASDAKQSTRVSVVTESAFFPGAANPDLQLDNATALTEVSPALGVCFPRPVTTPADYALAVAELAGSTVRVRFWCAPLMSSAAVYRNDSSGYGPVTLPGTVLSVQFGDDSGGWLAVLVQMPGAREGQRPFLVNRTGHFILPPFEGVLPTHSVLMKVENLWVVEGLILADLVTRRMETTGNEATGMHADSLSEAVHAFLKPPVGATTTGGWFGTSVDLIAYGGGQYWYTRRPLIPPAEDGSTWAYLFLPKAGGARELQQMRFSVSSSEAGALSLEQTENTMLQPTELPGLDGTTMASASQSNQYIFSTATTGWDWLKQTRIDADGYNTYESATVITDTTIEGECNELTCEGCQTLLAQRLCLAYNRCALINCVGTPVHQMRPLCGIGGLLKHWGEMSLRSTQGAWTIFTEMLALTLQLNMLSLKEAHLLWPEDAFLCYVCEAKDATAEFFSILTATVNSALQLGAADISYMYGGASNVDTNADAALTISSTALNGFMHQAALLPLYLMISSRQVMMCQVNGVLALMDEGGFKLSLRSADQSSASDIVAGQCLTVGAEVLAKHPGDSTEALHGTLGSLTSGAMQLMMVQQIEPLLHFMDSMLAYAIGLVHTMGVLVMSQNMAVCNPPDFSLTEVLSCACGDHRLQIPVARSTQGLAEGALWCTGVLSMVDGNNRPYYVYNKFTYAQLQTLAAGLDEYAKCVGTGLTGYRCEPPSTATPDDPEFFTRQGVTVANVLVKCRENFAEKQWDPYAFAFYNRDYNYLFDKAGTRPDFPPTDPYGIRECLQQDPSQGDLAGWCMQKFLAAAYPREEDYWAYERVDDSARPGGEYTDACLVFSGPADSKVPQFTDCVDGAGGGRCTLAGHIWTPRSDNNVPVAKQHRVLAHGTHATSQIQMLYESARRRVVDAVAASVALQTNTPEHVDAEFFSVEGDVLHQIMDCMFMGPYSRVDYWPIPSCYDGDECLEGPYWARDEAEGQSRAVDPNSCPSVPTIPFTCGSPSRKALMRYLVKDVLPSRGNPLGGNQNGSVIHETILLTLDEILADWTNTSRYGCSCAEGGFHPACCAANIPLLPPHLSKSYIPINSASVLQAMEDNLETMYDAAIEAVDPWLKHLELVSPGTRLGYAWETSSRVRDDARFLPTKPVSGYTAAEAMSPLLTSESTLWDVCHAALKQTFFTLPILSDGSDGVEFDPELASFDGDPQKLQEYVKEFTREAWRHSPLFRHYSPRHIPSHSNMCAQPPHAHPPPSKASYSPFTQAGASLLQSIELPQDVPVFSAQQFRVGEDACLCGWDRTGDTCHVPPTANTQPKVCAAARVCEDTNFTYHIRDEPEIMGAFSPDWHCPEFELSAHWGFTDPEAADTWLTSANNTPLVTSSRDLLRHGRAGLRLGNAWTMAAKAKESIKPTVRQVPLDRGILTTCAPPPTNVVDPTKALLDELFPAAQAVEESGAAAYCLRYVIEVARLEILRLVQAAEDENAQESISSEVATQEERVAIWNRRCGTQLHLLHLCVNLGAFRARTMVPTSTVCPHFKVTPSNADVTRRRAYATKECLVNADGNFFDPCRCMECKGERNTELDLERIVSTDACRIRFDPRRMLEEANRPIGWFDGAHPLPDPRESLLRKEFKGEILDDPDAVGNTASDSTAPWWRTEGLMSEAGGFCDGVLDWWPEEWDYPVGYHVTVPCDGDDTAYRSFAHAFALDEETGTLVYQHDLLRPEGLADTHFGIGGLCRRGNFGMQLFETNTMQYCTSLPVGGDTREDFTLPRTREHTGEWSEMKCSRSSAELPWPDSINSGETRYESSRFSVGTVPNMPHEQAESYPMTELDTSDVGPWQEIAQTGGLWGGQDSPCQDYELTLCETDADCPSRFTCRGRQAVGCKETNTCGGVCLNSAQVECVRHLDCPSTLMCSGVGRCVQPTLAVQNQLTDQGADAENSVAFGMAAAGQCGAGTRNYSMVGASYWGNTGRDLLRVHGMCSFEDWFKYTEYYANPNRGCSTLQANGVLSADPSICSNLKLDTLSQNQTRWWPTGALQPDLMYLRPTNCDRDYERVKGFTQCAPAEGAGATILFSDGSVTEPTERDRFVRIHSSRNRLLLAAMPDRNDTSLFGLLGLDGGVKSVSDLLSSNPDAHQYVPCALRTQCFSLPFTVDGRPTNRTYLKPGDPPARVGYNDATTFKCGVFGLDDPLNMGCRLDTELLPLYVALCRPLSNGGIDKCQRIMQADTATLCENIQERYQMTNLDRTTNLAKLKELFYVFPGFTSMSKYLEITDCMTSLHGMIAANARVSATPTSHGLYYPTMFALKEISFDWFYQCIVMAKMRVIDTSRRPQDCVAYKERLSHTLGDYHTTNPLTDSWDTYLRFVRGGYTTSAYTAHANAQASLARTAVSQARQAVQALLYQGGADLSYPVCSRNMLWRIGPYGEGTATDPHDPDLRAIIANWFDAQECRDTWTSGLINDLPPPPAGTTKVTASNWQQLLSMPDPTNLSPPAYPSQTMLDLIEARILSTMAMLTDPTVITSATGAIRFSHIPPPAYSLEGTPLPQALIPTRSLNQGESYADNDLTVPRTCAFLPAFDPAITSPQGCVPVTNAADHLLDRLMVCGGKQCTSVPIYARRNGFFNCRYTAANNIIQQDCSENNPGCHTTVLAQMYSEVLKRYTDSPIGSAPPRPLAATSMPWFDDANQWFTGFSLNTELDYERNIQPDQEKSVMCELTDPTKAIKYTECNNPHYAKLKAHAEEHYKHDAGVVIPAGGQLEWPIERGVLERGAILSFTNLNRPLKQRYMDSLFHDDTVCKGVVTGTQRVCWNIRPQEYVAVNPWLLGNFNPFEVCDVDFTSAGEGAKEYVYTQCLQENPDCASFISKPVPARCRPMHGKLVSFTGVPRQIAGESLDYNLCFHTNQEEGGECMHDHGLLGGFDGSPVAPPNDFVSMLEGTKYKGTSKYTVGGSLYEESEWDIPDDFRRGLFAGTNPLWQNATAPYGHIQISDWDIGGHRIGLAISRASSTDPISRLLVERLPMGAAGTDSGFLNGETQSKSLPTSSWIPSLRQVMEDEDEEVKALYTLARQQTENLGASCPLQRWIYYSGGHPQFSPVIPSALRAKHLFSPIHQGLLSHPTMTRSTRGAFLGKYRTSNGFCACPVIGDISQPQCLVPSTADRTRQCSLAQTIQSLTGRGEPTMSHVFPPLDHTRSTRRCTMQLDWPNVDATLRDGSPHAGEWQEASSPTYKECHTLDRFLPFKYSYRVSPDPIQPTTGTSTTIQEGVCQTARAVSLERAKVKSMGRCLRRGEFLPTDESATFTCNTPSQPISMPRRRRLTKQETLDRRLQKRQRCNQCSPPPPFTSTGGKPIPAESSFGRLYRHSVEQMLAKDLQEALMPCRGAGSCQFNTTAWQPGLFMHNYMHTPANLFNSPPEWTTPQSPTPPKEQVWDESSREWVYCPSVEALRTGEGCHGKMSRKDWVERKRTLCPRMVRSFSTAANSTADPLARTPFCSLDSSTDLLCKAVETARLEVTKANCLARGDTDCMPQPYVYTPASYVKSNNAWVHDSVQAFYTRINSSSCPLSTESAKRAETQSAFYRNYQLVCPANALSLIEKVLMAIRVIVTDVALLLSSMMTMGVEMLALLVSGNTNNMKESIVGEWLYIKSKGGAMMRSVSDILVDGMLDSGELGKEIMGFLMQTCEKIQEAAAWFLGIW